MATYRRAEATAAPTEHTLTELRVHGVGGSTPEELLDVPNTRLVAGGADAGFFRPEPWITIEGPPRNLEAYSWGGITSRARTRALWLLLLPFALMNVAGWMYDKATITEVRNGVPVESQRLRGLRVGLVRLEGLFVSLVVATLTSIITIDLVGSRCDPQGECVQRWYLAPWQWWADSRPDAVAVGIIVAGLFMLTVALIARLGQRRYGTGEKTPDQKDPALVLGLRDPAFWGRQDVELRLGKLHVAATVALVGLFGLESARRLEIDEGLLSLGVVVLAITLAATVVLLFFIGRAPNYAYRWITGVAIAGAALVVIALFRTTDPDPGGAAGLTIGPRIIFGSWAALFFGRWILYIWRRIVSAFRKAEQKQVTAAPEPAASAGRIERLRRWAARQWDDDSDPVLTLRAAVPVLGAGIAIVVGSSFILLFESWLNTGYGSTVLGSVAVFGALWIGAVALTAVWVWFSHPGRAIDAICSSDSLPPAETPDDEWWLDKIQSAESAARITDRVETVITVPAVMMFLGIWLSLSYESVEAWVGAVQPLASLGLSLLPLGVMAAMNSLYRSHSFRRSLGIIWDVATFWPRWFHPWAPPSYGERAVPHLRRRVESLVDDGGAVIMSAHSQGTVLTAAALAQIRDRNTLKRIAVLTHGSPLNRLYARHFDQYFCVDDYQRLANAAGPEGVVAWRNLYRLTDYIGGPLFSDPPRLRDAGPTSPNGSFEDVRVRDPYTAEPLLRGDPRPRTLNHSNYYVQDEYSATIAQYAEYFDPASTD